MAVAAAAVVVADAVDKTVVLVGTSVVIVRIESVDQGAVLDGTRGNSTMTMHQQQPRTTIDPSCSRECS